MRTRHQRQLAEQAGAAPSPPHALPTESRPRRVRAPKANALEGPSSQAQPEVPTSSSAQPSRSSRSGRTTQRARTRGGRSAAQAHNATQEENGEASGASTQNDDSAQSDISTQADGDTGDTVENPHGEIPKSPLGTATHPVSAAHAASLSGSPKRGANVGVSRSTLTAQPVRGNGFGAITSLAAPSVAIGEVAASSTPIQQKSSPSETSLLFANILSSPSRSSSPVTLGTLPPQSGVTGDVPGLALVESPNASPISAPITQGAPNTSTNNANAAGSDAQNQPSGMHLEPSGQVSHDETAQRPVLPCTGAPKSPSHPSLPAMPQLPQVRGLPDDYDKPYSLMHVMLDIYPPTTGDSDLSSKRESVALAFPTEQLPFHYQLSATLNPEMRHTFMRDATVSRILDESSLTEDIDVEMTVHDLKRKREEFQESFASNSNGSGTSWNGRRRANNNKKTGSAMRAHFAKLAATRRHAVLGESQSQGNVNERSEHNSSPRKRVKRSSGVPMLHDENGNLSLGRFQDATGEVDEAGYQSPNGANPYTADEVPDTNGQPLQGLYAEQLEREQLPETPRARGWALMNLLPTVQSVTRFIPFSTRRTPSAIEPPSRPEVDYTSSTTMRESYRANVENAPATPSRPSPPQRIVQTEPRQNISNADPTLEISATNHGERLAKRNHTEKSKKRLLTKAQIQERDKLKKEKEELRALKEQLKEEEARIAQEKKAWEEQRASLESAQAPGKKRKRMPSPDVIPLPPGGGFGLHPDYFGYDSSSEEESEGEQDSPTKARAVKKARLSSSDIPKGDPKRATPYEGVHFSPPTSSPITPSSNIFDKSITMTSIDANQQGSLSTPAAHPGRFAVPSPTDSEADEDDRQTMNPDGSSTRASPTKDNQGSSSTDAVTDSTVPPPTPNPSHASLPAAKIWQFTDPVEKARQKALQHQPKFGSRLRESSRLSSSTVGSEAGEQVGGTSAETAANTSEVNTGSRDSEYDPRRPALLPPFDMASEKIGHTAKAVESNAEPEHQSAPVSVTPEGTIDQSTTLEPSISSAGSQSISSQPKRQPEQTEESPAIQVTQPVSNINEKSEHAQASDPPAQTTGQSAAEKMRKLLQERYPEKAKGILSRNPGLNRDSPPPISTPTTAARSGTNSAVQVPAAIAAATSTFQLDPKKSPSISLDPHEPQSNREKEIKWDYPSFSESLDTTLQEHLNTKELRSKEFNIEEVDDEFEQWKYVDSEHKAEIAKDVWGLPIHGFDKESLRPRVRRRIEEQSGGLEPDLDDFEKAYDEFRTLWWQQQPASAS